MPALFAASTCGEHRQSCYRAVSRAEAWVTGSRTFGVVSWTARSPVLLRPGQPFISWKRGTTSAERTRCRNLEESDFDASRYRPSLRISRRVPLLGQVMIQVVNRFPPFGQNRPLWIQWVSGHYVLEAAFFFSRGPHRLDTCFYEPIPFIGIERKHSLDDHFAHPPLIDDKRPWAHFFERPTSCFPPARDTTWIRACLISSDRSEPQLLRHARHSGENLGRT